MSISFNCPCGKVLSAKEWDAGKKGVCPDCGRKILVPGTADSSLGEDPAKKLAQSAAMMENWLFAHQRQIWIAAGFTSCLIAVIIVGVVLSRSWKPKQDILPVDPPRIGVTPPKPGPHADPSLWETNFSSFAEAIQLAIRDQEDLEDKFQGRSIQWTVTYRSCQERVNLYFDEAVPLLQANRGINVWATLLPSEAIKAERLREGTQVVIKGRIGTITSARTAEHPLGVVILGPIECTVDSLQ